MKQLRPESKEETGPFASVPKPFNVTELTARIKGVLEPAFLQVWVIGEVSNYRPAASGHIYFSLKDQTSCIAAAIFGWGARKKNFELKDGLKILCRGKITVYPPRGSYQLAVDHVEPLGTGALQLAFEQLKAKLAAEGFFDRDQKQVLPSYPSRITVITSPTGAVIQDVLTILNRRAPHIHVVVLPVLVQGEEAPAQLIRALDLANREAFGEIIILARGGGSMEDLWCFNHEGLAREIRKSMIPVVSAIGHEVDFTISDFVADLRAPTPSAAAEMVTENWVAVAHQIKEFRIRLSSLILKDLATLKAILAHVAARVVSPKDRLREQIQKIDELYMRLERGVQVVLDRKLSILEQKMGKLNALSPLRVLERGYALVRDPYSNGAVVNSLKQVRLGQELQVTFYDGQTKVRVIELGTV